jgi:predicted Zn finger-like uncharacterized protein
MSFTTRCPACGTMFKVVPDQLKISDGWVRCGHCADVFDATLYLEAWAPPAPAPAPPTEPLAEPAQAIDTPQESAPWVEPAPDPTALMPNEAAPIETAPPDPVWAEQPSQAVWQSDPSPEPLPEAWAGSPEEAAGPVSEGWLVSPEVAADAHVHGQAAQELDGPRRYADEAEVPTAWTPDTEPEPERPPSVRLPDAPSETPAPADAAPEPDFLTELQRFAAASTGATTPARTDSAPETDPVAVAFSTPEADGAATADEPGFVRQARRQAFWRSPGVRAALGVLGVLLALLLAAQWALHERDDLAASHPELAPVLELLCEPLGCAIGPVQRIEAVVIDSSTLVRRLGNFYSFDLVLKNTAALPVAVPALELSLTDTRDSVIARRVFLPSELPGAPALLPAQGNLSLSLRLSITDAGAVPMAGYRALVFYP